MADTTSVTTDLSYTYDSNDICLTIYPYDNYKKIALYERVNGTDTEYSIDRSDTYTYYLEFGDGSSSNKKKVTIEECKDYYSSSGDYVKLSSNELLFKITQKEAYEILSLSSNVFNVVRAVVVDDDVYQSSTTEVQTIFQGKWATSEDRKNTNYSQLVQTLQERVSDLLNTNDSLNSRIIELLEEVANLTSENETLKDYEKYKDMYEELLNEQEQSTTYTGTAIDYDAKYIKVDIDDETLASQVNNYLDTLTT